MQSIVSSAKPKMNAIIKENLHRFWPIAFVYFLILFMVTVFIAILDTSEANGFDIIWNTINNGRLVIPVITSAASLTFAVCIFGFLHNTGQASVTHALPFSRNTLLRILSLVLFYLLHPSSCSHSACYPFALVQMHTIQTHISEYLHLHRF